MLGEGLAYGVIGMLDVFRDPRADQPALSDALGEDDAPFCSPLGALAELARMSFRNCSLFILYSLGSSKNSK